MPGKKRKKKKAARPGYIKRALKPKAAKTAPAIEGKSGKVRYFLKHKPGIIGVALIALVGVLVYSNSFRGAFVFDDITNIADNNAIVGIGSAFTDTLHSRAVGYFTFALNYKINDLDVEGYHIFNLAVHLTCALLVFWLVTLTLKTPFFKRTRLAESRLTPLIIALFAGLVFVAHPVQTQAVTYTVQRFTSLATLFYLLSLALYAKWRISTESPGTINLFGNKITIYLRLRKVFFYLASLASALLAMLTKEIAFTLPTVIALWEFSFFNGSVKKRIANLLPFVLMMPVIPLIIALGDNALLAAAGTEEPPPAGDYFLTQGRVIVTYLRLFFFPLNQNLDYDYPVYQSLFNPNVLLSFVSLIAVAGMGVFLWRFAAKRSEWALLRLAAFGIFWFFITLSVESSFITIADVIFEHRLYLPSVGLIVAAVALAAAATASARGRVPSVPKVVIPLAAVVVVVLAVATYERNRVWGDPITLWEDTASKSPGKARPHNNLGAYLRQTGQLDKAETEFKRAIQFNPDYADGHFNLGVIYNARGQPEKAEAEYALAIYYEPDHTEAHNNLGVIYKDMGQLDKAEDEYKQAIEYEPDYAEAHNNLGVLYGERGHLDKAEDEFKRAIDLKPNYADAVFNLGMNYVYNNRHADAIDPLNKVVEINPGNYVAHNNLGNIYLEQQRFDKALEEYQAALRIKPDYQEARDNIQLLEAMKRQ